MLWKTKKTSAGTHSPSPTEPVQAPSEAQPGKFEISPENLDGSTKRPPGAFVVAKGYRVSASVVTARPVVVLGELVGDSLTSPSVSVGPQGRLAIPVEANSLSVEGVVEKAVKVRDGVEVKAGGAVLADVEAAAISIAPGGIVSGARLAIGPLRAA
jgi:cytoskeletal protein CcmA (bactofilin family)